MAADPTSVPGVPAADDESDVRIPVEIEVVSGPDAGQLHFPVQIEVLPAAASVQADDLIDQALARLAAALGNTCP